MVMYDQLPYSNTKFLFHSCHWLSVRFCAYDYSYLSRMWLLIDIPAPLAGGALQACFLHMSIVPILRDFSAHFESPKDGKDSFSPKCGCLPYSRQLCSRSNTGKKTVVRKWKPARKLPSSPYHNHYHRCVRKRDEFYQHLLRWWLCSTALQLLQGLRRAGLQERNDIWLFLFLERSRKPVLTTTYGGTGIHRFFVPGPYSRNNV